jgi:6-phosphogluconolactonase/glucosamine-6-phosphate isomerase/deaminase
MNGLSQDTSVSYRPNVSPPPNWLSADALGNASLLKELDNFRHECPAWLYLAAISSLSDDAEFKNKISKNARQNLECWNNNFSVCNQIRASFEQSAGPAVCSLDTGHDMYVGQTPDKTAQLVSKLLEVTLSKQGSQKAYGLFATGKTMETVYSSLNRRKLPFYKLNFISHLDNYLDANPEHSFADELRKVWKNFFIAERAKIFVEDKKSVKGVSKLIELAEQNGHFGFCLLGIGPSVSPHIAFNEPSSVLLSAARELQLSPGTQARDKERFSGKCYSSAVTIGTLDILRIPMQILVFYGKDKAKSLAESFSGGLNPRYPASSLLLSGKRLFIFADQEAADELARTNLSFANCALPAAV